MEDEKGEASEGHRSSQHCHLCPHSFISPRPGWAGPQPPPCLGQPPTPSLAGQHLPPARAQPPTHGSSQGQVCQAIRAARTPHFTSSCRADLCREAVSGGSPTSQTRHTAVTPFLFLFPSTALPCHVGIAGCWCVHPLVEDFLLLSWGQSFGILSGVYCS